MDMVEKLGYKELIVENFLWFFPLKTGVFIIASVNIILVMLMVYFEILNDVPAIDELLLLQLIGSVLLIIAAITQDRMLIVPWTSITTIFTMGAAFHHRSTDDTYPFHGLLYLPQAAFTASIVYSLAIVYSYYDELHNEVYAIPEKQDAVPVTITPISSS